MADELKYTTTVADDIVTTSKVWAKPTGAKFGTFSCDVPWYFHGQEVVSATTRQKVAADGFMSGVPVENAKQITVSAQTGNLAHVSVTWAF